MLGFVRADHENLEVFVVSRATLRRSGEFLAGIRTVGKTNQRPRSSEPRAAARFAGHALDLRQIVSSPGVKRAMLGIGHFCDRDRDSYPVLESELFKNGDISLLKGLISSIAFIMKPAVHIDRDNRPIRRANASRLLNVDFASQSAATENAQKENKRYRQKTNFKTFAQGRTPRLSFRSTSAFPFKVNLA